MKKIILFIMIMFLFPLASALETQITIQSQPNADVMVNFLDLNTGRVISGTGTFNEKADSNGKVIIPYNSEDKLLRFSIGVQIGGVFKSFEGFNGSKSNYAKFNMVEAGKEILINVNTDTPTLDYIGVEEEVAEEEPVEEVAEEESIIEEIVVKEETEVESNPITGFAIDSKNLVPSSKKIIYSVILIVLIVAIILIFLFLKKKSSKNINSVVKLREKKDPVQEEEELEDAERRIKEAEREIKEIRNKKSELEEAEKKFEEDRKRLEELKGNIGR